MRSLVAASFAAALLAVSTTSFADDVGAPAPLAPTAAAAPVAAVQPASRTRRNVGVGLMIGGGVGLLGGIAGAVGMGLADNVSCDANCTGQFPPGARVAEGIATGVMGGVVFAGLLLYMSSASSEPTARSAVQPTARGLAVSF
jgi:hypothetical protein